MVAALVSGVLLSTALAAGGASRAGAATPGGPAGPGAAGRAVRVAGTPRLPSGAVVTGPTPASETVTSDLALKPLDPAALDAFVAAVSTPGSPEFRHYLTKDQFGPLFGPSAATIAGARSWLASEGLRVGTTSPDGLLIPVTGSVAAMERAFGVSVVDTHLASGRSARYVTSAPAVPPALAPEVQGLIGLSSVAMARPQIVPARAGGATRPRYGAGLPRPGVGSAFGGAHTPGRSGRHLYGSGGQRGLHGRCHRGGLRTEQPLRPRRDRKR